MILNNCNNSCPEHKFNLIFIDEVSAQTDYFSSQKKEGTIQYGYMDIWEGNSHIEIRQRNRRRWLEERREYGKKPLPIISWLKYNNDNKHDMVIFYKKWKKYN